MMSFSNDGWKDYIYWEEQDKKTLKKINRLFQSIERDGPMSGEGQPEKLRNFTDTYSRHIDEKNRLVYIATAGNFTVESCRGHYEDK